MEIFSEFEAYVEEQHFNTVTKLSYISKEFASRLKLIEIVALLLSIKFLTIALAVVFYI